MNIAIIGTGKVGQTLAEGWARTGHHIFLGVRDYNKPAIQKLTQSFDNITAHDIRQAIELAEIITISIHPEGLRELIVQAGPVKNKIIIDTMNSFDDSLVPFKNTSDALQILTENEHVVKAFNMTGYENLKGPVYGTSKVDIFICGDHHDDKNTVKKLAEDLNLECHDFGDLSKANLLENFAKIWINLAINQGYGRNIAFKLLRR